MHGVEAVRPRRLARGQPISGHPGRMAGRRATAPPSFIGIAARDRDAGQSGTGRVRVGMRLVLAVLYLLAGVFHLRSTATFVAIVPPIVPDPHAVVILTGYCELLGGAALLIRRLRRTAGSMLALYAVCVFPANVYQAIAHVPVDGHVMSWAYHGPRFAAEPILIWWTLFCAGITDWPFRRGTRGRRAA